MKFFSNPFKHVSDEEYINDIRRQIKTLDRLRHWIILFNIGLLLVFAWIYSSMFAIIQKLQQPAILNILQGFLSGTLLGIFLGFTFISLVHNLMFMLGSQRTERLLLKHLDSPEAEQSDWGDDNDGENDYS